MARGNGFCRTWFRAVDGPHRPLRTYFLAALLLVAIIPLILLTSINLWHVAGREEAQSRERLLDTAFHIAAHIDDYIDEHLSAVMSFASLLPVAAHEPAQLKRALQSHHSAFEGFITMVVTNRHGDAIATSPAAVAARGNTNVSDRDYFRQPLHTGQVYVSDVFRGRGLGNDPIVALSAPVRDPGGTIQGVVEGSLNLNKLARMTSRPGGRPDIHIVIVDRQDRVVFSEGERYAFLQPLGGTPLMRMIHEAGKATFRDSVADALVAAHQTRAGWRVVVSQPFAALRREVWLSVLRALAWLGVVTGISFGLARLSAARVTRPLSLLLKAVRALKADGIAEPAAPHFRAAPVEITELAASFDSMSERLAHSYRDLRTANRELEARVQERTTELAAANRLLEDQIAEKNSALALLVLRDRAIAAASNGITITDALLPGTPIVYLNPGFEDLTGYSASEVLGGGWDFLNGPETDPEALQVIEQAARDGVNCCVDLIAYNKEGAPFWMHVSLNPVRDESGRVTHFIGIQSDITQRKQIERLKTELVSTVSHELRTPLTCLRGFTELLMQRDYPRDKELRFLGIVDREAIRLGQLIDDFLDLQRIESGREQFRFQLFDLAELIADVHGVFALDSARHTLHTEIASPLPLVRIDPDRIRQVMANLVSNAIKFSPEGGPVSIGARAADGRVICWVRDEGIGIGADSIQKLFTRFFRVDNTETRRIGGTGLGLELVKRLIEAHNGEVWVESELGCGATFYFAFPAETVAVSVAEHTAIPASPSSPRMTTAIRPA